MAYHPRYGWTWKNMVWQSNTLGPQHLQHQPSIFTPPGVLKAKPNPSHLWTGGSPQVAPTGDWRSTLPSGNQTWLAQKTPINCVKIVYERWIFRQCTVCLPHTHIYVYIYMYKLFCANIFPASKLTPVILQPWDDVATKWHVSPQFSDIHGSLVRKIRQAVNGLVEGNIYEWTPLQTHSLLAQHPQSLIVSVTNISIYLYFWTLFSTVNTIAF